MERSATCTASPRSAARMAARARRSDPGLPVRRRAELHSNVLRVFGLLSDLQLLRRRRVPGPGGSPGICVPTTRPGFSVCVYSLAPLAYCGDRMATIPEATFFRCMHNPNTTNNQAVNDPY